MKTRSKSLMVLLGIFMIPFFLYLIKIDFYSIFLNDMNLKEIRINSIFFNIMFYIVIVVSVILWDLKGSIYAMIVYLSLVAINVRTFGELNDPRYLEYLIEDITMVLVFISLVGYYVYKNKHKELLLSQKIKELEETKKILKIKDLALGSSQSAITFVTPDKKITYANKAFYDFVGAITESDVINQCIANFHIDEGFVIRDRLLQGKNWWGEARIRKINGEKADVLLTINNIRDENGNTYGSMGSFVDDRKRKQALESLKKAKEEAERANNAKSIFLRTISSNIKTPINEIIGMMKLISKDELTDKQVKWLGVATQSAHTLLQVLSDILELTKIKSGDMQLIKETFSITNLFKDVVNHFAILGELKGISVKYIIDTEVPNEVIGDHVRLSQVLEHIISNSVKFTYEGDVFIKCEKISCSDEALKVKITVSDTGVGVSSDKIDSLFDKFSQINTPEKIQYIGIGLGLPITKKMVSSMGGIINMKSEEGKGSEVTIVLPFMKKINKNKILVAEDDSVNQEYIMELLKKGGYEVTLVENGLDTFREFETGGYSIILMDIHMPGMDGYWITKKIREKEVEKGSRIHVIALIEPTLVGHEYEALNTDMDGCILKPIVEKELYDMIEKFTE